MVKRTFPQLTSMSVIDPKADIGTQLAISNFSAQMDRTIAHIGNGIDVIRKDKNFRSLDGRRHKRRLGTG